MQISHTSPQTHNPLLGASHYESAEFIVGYVAGTYGTTLAALIAPGRDPLLVEARRVAITLLAERGYGASTIGRMIGRDHSTVLHHKAKVEQGAIEPEEREMLEDSRAHLARLSGRALVRA